MTRYFNSRPALLAGSMILLAASTARAHFVWIDVPRGEQRWQAQVVFNETAEPGEAQLIGKIAQTKAWARTAAGQTSDLELVTATGELAALVAKLPADTATVEAACDYGVYNRVPRGVRLHYFAKCLVAGTQAPASERLRLDLAAQIDEGKVTVTVRFDGKPDPTAVLSAIDEKGEEQELKLDADGRVSIEPAPKRLALRARHATPESGEADGQQYAQTWYCSTLVIASGSTGEETAGQALAAARAGRAVWSDFPGFTADLTIRGDDAALEARATIDSSGVVTLSGDRSPLHDWAQEQLESLVQHRMPDGEVSEGNVSFVDEPTAHPLGRLIDLGDPRLQSRYRLKEGVILQVNRVTGPTRFTISVLAIQRNSEGKYLPQAFTMSFWDVASGELKQSLAYWNAWHRVGRFDLPERIVEIAAREQGAQTREMRLRNWALLEAKPQSAAAK